MAAAAFRPFVSLVVIHGDGVPQRIDATIRHLGLCFLVALADAICSTNSGSDRMTIKRMTKFCSVAAMALLVIVSLGPGKWLPRTGLGWQIEHFLAFFAVTSIVCLAWPRPFVVGGALMAVAALLEGLQAFTPDRFPDLLAAFYGAGGALVAALLAELFIRARRLHS